MRKNEIRENKAVEGVAWLGANQTYTAVFAGISAVLILPRLRRGVMHRTLRPFRSDEVKRTHQILNKRMTG